MPITHNISKRLMIAMYLLLVMSSCASLKIQLYSDLRWVRVAEDTVSCSQQRVTFIIIPRRGDDQNVAFFYQDECRRIWAEHLQMEPNSKTRYRGYGEDGVHYSVFVSPDQEEIYIGFRCTNLAATKTRCR